MLIGECSGPMVIVRVPRPSSNRTAVTTGAGGVATVAVTARVPVPVSCSCAVRVMAGEICRSPRP